MGILQTICVETLLLVLLLLERNSYLKPYNCVQIIIKNIWNHIIVYKLFLHSYLVCISVKNI